MIILGRGIKIIIVNLGLNIINFRFLVKGHLLITNCIYSNKGKHYKIKFNFNKKLIIKAIINSAFH